MAATTAAALDEELNQYYTDAHGLVSSKRLSGTKTESNYQGNGVLYLSEWVVLLARTGRLSDDRKLQFTLTVRSCYRKPGLVCRDRPGTWWADQQQEGPDDLIGAAAASSVCGRWIAREMLAYGLTHSARLSDLLPFFTDYASRAGWERTGRLVAKVLSLFGDDLEFAFNFNTGPDQGDEVNSGSWLGRNRSFVAHLYYAAGETPPHFLDRLAWAVAVLTGGAGRSVDGFKLSALLVFANTTPTWYQRLARWWFSRRIAKEGGLSGVYGLYYETGHPIVELARLAPTELYATRVDASAPTTRSI